jgi:hypothetical protein
MIRNPSEYIASFAFRENAPLREGRFAPVSREIVSTLRFVRSYFSTHDLTTRASASASRPHESAEYETTHRGPV